MMALDIKLENTVTGQADMVLVPRRPTQAMLDAAWANAHDENAEGVWGDMIEEWELCREQGEVRKR